MHTIPELRESRVFRGTYRGQPFKIVHWRFEGDALINDYPSGNWNYYIYLNEKKVIDFPKYWIEPQEYQITPETPKRIKYDYYANPVSDIEMHGGITWYEPSGQLVGHRYIEIGCDYQHLNDTGMFHDQHDVLRDVMATIDWCYDNGIYIPEAPTSTKSAS